MAESYPVISGGKKEGIGQGKRGWEGSEKVVWEFPRRLTSGAGGYLRCRAGLGRHAADPSHGSRRDGLAKWS